MSEARGPDGDGNREEAVAEVSDLYTGNAIERQFSDVFEICLPHCFPVRVSLRLKVHLLLGGFVSNLYT